MDQIEIRKAILADLEQIQYIGKQTFRETFSDANTERDMEMYLAENFNLDRLTTELKNPDSEFYLAMLDNRVIGYLKINVGQAQTELKDENALEIERIYVLQEFHRQKVGQALINKALEIARQKSISYAWLGVWEKNERAISFYRKNGFVEFDTHIFKLGADEQTDLMMKRKMK